MKPLNHFEAVSVFREADEVVTIRLFREKVPEGNTRQAGVVNLSLSESLTPRSDNEDHQVIMLVDTHCIFLHGNILLIISVQESKNDR